jgi:hypothetical protein
MMMVESDERCCFVGFGRDSFHAQRSVPRFALLAGKICRRAKYIGEYEIFEKDQTQTHPTETYYAFRSTGKICVL